MRSAGKHQPLWLRMGLSDEAGHVLQHTWCYIRCLTGDLAIKSEWGSGDSTIAAVLVWPRSVVAKISHRLVNEQWAEAFLNRACLFAKQVYHVQEIRMDGHLCENASKVFLTDAKAAPGITLIKKTSYFQLWRNSAEKHTDTTEVIESGSMILFKLSVVRTCSTTTSCPPSVNLLSNTLVYFWLFWETRLLTLVLFANHNTFKDGFIICDKQIFA